MSKLIIEKDVLQYIEDLQKNTKEIEEKLLNIQNQKLKEFKISINNISNNCISDIQLLLNKTHSKIKNNLANNKIEDDVLYDFNLEVQAILLKAKNDLDNYKNEFDIEIKEEIESEILRLKTFISENSEEIKKALQAALYQINRSENSALNRLEETYDLGVETIVSAEKTALRNIKILVEELSLKLEGKVEDIEAAINEKLENALDTIKKLEEEAVNNIAKMEITIKNALEAAKEEIIAEMREMIDNFEFTLKGYVDEMKAELTAHKNKILEELEFNKELLIIELEKEKNRVIESIREEEYRIIQNLNNREQEIISEIISVVEGFDEELEIIKTAKIKEFMDAIHSLKEQCLDEIIDIVEDCLDELKNSTNIHLQELLSAVALHLIELKNACQGHLQHIKDAVNEHIKELQNIFESLKQELINESNKQQDLIVKKGEEVVDGIVDSALEEMDKILSNIKEQRYITVLPAGETIIQLPKDEFIINDRVKVYIDGIMHIQDGFFDVNKLERRITLFEPYEYDTNIVVIEDLPDEDMQAIKDQLYIDGQKFVDESLEKIKQAGEDTVKESVEKIEEETDRCIDSIAENAKEEASVKIDEYIKSLVEQKFSTVLDKNSTVISLPEEFVISQRMRVFIDGKLLSPEKHYTLDRINRTINLIKPYSYSTDILVTDDLPDTNIEELKKNFYEEANNYREEALKEISDIKDKSVDEIDEYAKDKKDEVINEIDNYMDSFREGVYSTEVLPNQSVIYVPPIEFVVNRSVKVYFDGVLQTLKKHYTINFLENSITILNPFIYPIDVLLLQNIPVTNLPKREATDEEIDSLFEKPYRLGTDEDIDGLYERKEASDNDIDALFK